MLTTGFRNLLKYARAAAFGCVFSAAGTGAQARDHVLVMSISAYPYVKQLPGAIYDAGNALAIAQHLGYDTANAQAFKEDQLAGDGILRAVKSIASQVKQGDRFFMYYSGHGVRVPFASGCAEMLVAFDTRPDQPKLIRTRDLILEVDKVRHLLSDAFLFFDACHSGGHREVAVGRSSAHPQNHTPYGGNGDVEGLTSKSPAVRGAEQCVQIGNLSAAREYFGEAAAVEQAVGRGSNLTKKPLHFTFLAAARDNEEALDVNGKGGLATNAVLNCLQVGVTNQTGTGIVDVGDLKVCAQDYVNKTVPTISRKHLAPHLEVYGNAQKYLPAVRVKAATSEAALKEAERVANVLKHIAANANPNWGFNAWFDRDHVQMNQVATLHYSSAMDGHLSVLYIGSDKNDIQWLLKSYPMQAAGPTILWPTKIYGEPGENLFTVILTRDKLDHDAILRGAKSGKAELTIALAQNLACAVEGQRNATAFNPESTCTHRNATVFQPKSGGGIGAGTPSGYGATFLTVTGY